MGALAIHRARFARRHELAELLQKTLCSDGVLLGRREDFLFLKRFVAVRPTTLRRENCRFANGDQPAVPVSSWVY